MSNQERKPYVVSADSQGLLRNWARKNQLIVPNTDYFQGMQNDLEATLRRYFDSVDIVPEDFLRCGLNGLVKSSPVPVVSLDRAYITRQQSNLLGFIDATRTVDVNLNTTGLGGRAWEMSLEKQLSQLAIKQTGKTIALIDDVIFEGKTMLQLIKRLQSKGVRVDAVYAGITIKEGAALLENNGIQVRSLLVYDQVIDEICERDFVVGTPYSGRSVIGSNEVIAGAPYIYPFGKPIEWASIPPENAADFSLFCLSQALQLWAKTEQLSGQQIATSQVEKPVFGLPANKSISQALSTTIERLSYE